jgi:hypothetical protein
MAQHTPHVPPTKADLASARKTVKSASGAQRGIAENIEKKLGPVGPGKHNDIRTQALIDWLHNTPKVQRDIEKKG